jgi:hypothetical protein
MTDSGPEIPSSATAILRPGDKLIVGLHHPQDQQDAVKFHADLKEFLPGTQVLLMDGVASLAVYRPDSDGSSLCPPSAPGSQGFGGALVVLKAGGQVARHGWNGKGMFVAYQAGYPDGIAINANTAKATGIPQGTVCAFKPYLMLKGADGEFVPWVASQADLLADDWYAV